MLTLTLGWTNASAQTDVTSTYITNADFSSTDGWSQYVSSGYKDIGNGLIGTYGVRTNEGQAISTVDATHLATEYCFGFECRWSSNYASYNQTTQELPVGAYTLMFDVENTNPNTSKATYDNLFYVQVGDTKYTDNSTEWMNAGKSNWTTHTITFNITTASTAIISVGYGTGSNNIGSTNTPTVHISHLKLTWTDPLQAAKDALQAEIDKAKLCDAKEGLAQAIADAEAVLASATTEQELVEALATLQAADKDAVLRYENGLADATATNGMMTSFLVNGTFDSGISPWQRTGGFQNNQTASNQQGDFTGNFYENWDGTAKVNKMYQTINNIPNGTYKLKIAAFVNTLADPNESQYVFANDDKTFLTTGDPTFYEVWTVVTNNQVEVGLEQTTATANWMGIDNVSLTYYGAGDVISQAQAGAHKADWDAALAAAQAAVANTDYANVTGEELTNLNAEIAKDEPTTAEGYDAATAALNAATKAFTEAKESYDAFVAEKAYAESLGMTVATGSPSSAENAVLGTNTIKVEEYTYVTENFPQDFSDVYLATPTTNTFDALTEQHWSGENRSYFDFWNGSSADRELTYVITLPAGRYIIKAAGRGQANTASNVTISDGTTTVPFFMKGDTGLGINKAGVTSFDPDDEAGFANNNAGRGWEWRYLLMELDEEKEVTLSLKGHVNNSWIGACDFALLTTEDNTSINKAAYEAALANANAALENNDYAVVTGEERTNLSAEVEKEEPTTASGYDEATEALTAATAAFTAAKVSYDALITAKAIAAAEEEEYPYASADKKAAFESAVETANETVTNAEDAADKASALTTAQRTWVESNAMAEGVTDFEVVDYTNNIENARAQQGDQNAVVPGQAWGWTKNVSRKSDEKPTYADGTTLNYLDGGNWSGSSWDITVTQKIKVPSGKYLLSVTARAATELTTFELIANNETVTLKNLGADVNTGTFGRGYNDGFVVFEVADANDEVTIGVHGAANSVHQWMSFTNFRLVKIAELDPVSITIKAGFPGTTYSCDKALDFTNVEDIKAYIITSATGTTQQVYQVPANTGLYIEATTTPTSNLEVEVPVYAGTDISSTTDNLLIATDGNTEYNSNSTTTYYAYGKQNEKYAFFKVTANTEKPYKPSANKALLAVPTAQAKDFIEVNGGDATSINAVETLQNENAAIYNLNGQKVNKAQKGVYILNGKKVVIK